MIIAINRGKCKQKNYMDWSHLWFSRTTERICLLTTFGSNDASAVASRFASSRFSRFTVMSVISSTVTL